MAPKSLQWCEAGRLHTFPDATHWVHLEKSAEVNDAIHGFFREER
jgi:pimeloyl-ACP methyl ester carboxylesterase